MTVGFFPATVMPDPDWWQALWPQPGQVLVDLGVAPGTETAVDLCCGDGLFTAPLARLARHVVALDIDPQMLARARKKVAAVSNAGTCDFVEGDANDIARLVSRPADLVLMVNTFHGVPDKARLATGVAAVLSRLYKQRWFKNSHEIWRSAPRRSVCEGCLRCQA